MTYESKYLDLSHGGAGWHDDWKQYSNDQFVRLVAQLEIMPREKLHTLCDRLHLSFSGEDWFERTPMEQILGALLADYSPAELLKAVREVISPV